MERDALARFMLVLSGVLYALSLVSSAWLVVSARVMASDPYESRGGATNFVGPLRVVQCEPHDNDDECEGAWLYTVTKKDDKVFGLLSVGVFLVGLAAMLLVFSQWSPRLRRKHPPATRLTVGFCVGSIVCAMAFAALSPWGITGVGYAFVSLFAAAILGALGGALFWPARTAIAHPDDKYKVK